MYRKIFVSISLIVLMLATGFGIAALLVATRKEAPRHVPPDSSPFVQTMTLQREDVVERYVGFGSARPDRSTTVTAEVAARIIELLDDIEAGSVVTSGQLLLRMDDRDPRLELARTEALGAADQASMDELTAEAEVLKKLMQTAEQELRVTRDERKRLADLYEKGLAASKEYDFANLAYQRAHRVVQGYQMELAKNGPRLARFAASKRSQEALAGLAKLNIERCEIRAPFSGVIESLFVEQGDRVGPGIPLLTLIDPSHVEVPIQLASAVYDRVVVGADCELRSENRAGVQWLGKVARVAPSADESTRTFSAYVDVDNSTQSQPLIPGVFVRAEVSGSRHLNALLVPRHAVRDSHVFVAQAGVARARKVQIKRLVGERAIVTGDVSEGDRVVLTNLGLLSDGVAVRMQTEERTSPSVSEGPSHADRGQGIMP